MAITNTWSVTQMFTVPELDGNLDVVFLVQWNLSATDGSHIGNIHGSVGIPAPSAAFTAYGDLTELQVLGWVHALMGPDKVAEYELNVAQQITEQSNPPASLPWN